MLAQVVDRGQKSKPGMGRDQRAHRLLLGRADLENQVSARHEKSDRLIDQAGNDSEAVCPAVEREVRLVLTHADFESGDLAGGDVGRVGKDGVKRCLAGNRLEQVTQAKVDATGQAVLGGILAPARGRQKTRRWP